MSQSRAAWNPSQARTQANRINTKNTRQLAGVFLCVGRLLAQLSFRSLNDSSRAPYLNSLHCLKSRCAACLRQLILLSARLGIFADGIGDLSQGHSIFKALLRKRAAADYWLSGPLGGRVPQTPYFLNLMIEKWKVWRGSSNRVRGWPFGWIPHFRSPLIWMILKGAWYELNMGCRGSPLLPAA